MQIAAEEEHKLSEVTLKLRVTEDELQKATLRAGNFEERVEILERAIDETGENLAATDQRYNEATEREIEAEEKIEFLLDQLKELVTRYVTSWYCKQCSLTELIDNYCYNNYIEDWIKIME